MASFAVSFRLVDSYGYADRYKSVTEKIESLSTTAVWSETSSFYLVQYAGTAQAFADAVYLGSTMRSDDILLVVEIGGKGYGICGKNDYPNSLAKFFR